MSSDRFLPFEEAREYVRKLGLKNSNEWKTYSYSGNKPDNIPGFPHLTYKKEWRGWSNWLSNSSGISSYIGDPIETKNKLEEKTEFSKIRTMCQPFEKAREFSRTLGMKDIKNWMKYCKAGTKPKDIPASPEIVYRERWKGWDDWLGTNQEIEDNFDEKMSFEKEDHFEEKIPAQEKVSFEKEDNVEEEKSIEEKIKETNNLRTEIQQSYTEIDNRNPAADYSHVEMFELLEHYLKLLPRDKKYRDVRNFL